MDEMERVHLGLALSGGGFRATLFHLGVVRLLYESGYLGGNAQAGRKGIVRRMGAVSGGSILAAHLALNWNRYTAEQDKFDEAAKELIGFVQKDIRGRIIRSWILAWVWLVPRIIARMFRKTISNLLQSHYDQLFKNAPKAAPLKDLFKPARLRSLFEPARLKNLRQPGVPEVYFNCTSLTSGSACCFGPTGFTRFRTDGEAELISSNELRVSFAVAASSAFPPLFPPIEISYKTLFTSQGEFPNPHYLSDGGVFDNLGINPWIWTNADGSKVFDKLIVCNAEGFFDSEYDKNYTWLVSRNVRASDLLMTRVSELQLGALKENPPVAIGIKDILDEQVRVDGSTDHTISVERQRTLSKIRTDLDMFSSYEVTALIAHGFSVARRSLIDHGLIPEDAPKHTWDPLGKLEMLAKGGDKLTRMLRRGSRRKWRLLSIRDPASLLLAIATMALLGTDIYYAVRAYQAYVQAAETEAVRRVGQQVDAKVSDLNATISDLREQLARKGGGPQTTGAAGPATTTTSLQICAGEFSENCPSGTVWLPCGTSVKDWVSSQCSNFSITRISTRGGNKCGYSIDQVFCTKPMDR